MVQSVEGGTTEPDAPLLPPRHHHRHRHHSHKLAQIPGCSPTARSEVNGELQVSDTDCMSRLGRRGESEGGPRRAGHGCGHWGAAGPGTCTRQPAGPRDDDGTPLIRLLVLGGHGVGKSAVTVRYLTRRFIGEYKSQVDIIYRQTLEVDGIKVDLEIIDISSRPVSLSSCVKYCGNDTLPTLEICQCDCYLVVYSVADRRTFVTANQLLHAIFKLRPNMPFPTITLLGNKQDLEHSRQCGREHCLAGIMFHSPQNSVLEMELQVLLRF
ncbi:ras-related protein R-Ras-like [Penaeus indicus]|uniref:ras-related protein R-Ras-like n=1 Tax=Penaeus indicus TaxID=29960 RepID=UPI00300CE901